MRIRPSSKTALFLLTLVASCGGGSTGDPIPDATVASVTIVSPATTIAPGSSVQMAAIARNAAGNTISAPAPSWSSSVTAVATVSTTGLVSGLTTGSTVIMATISGVPGTRNLSVQTVTPVPSATVEAGADNSFTPQQVDLSVGGTVTWNFGAVVHNVNFGSGPGTPADIGATSNAAVTRTFTAAGSFPYSCSIHGGMNGTVIVH